MRYYSCRQNRDNTCEKFERSECDDCQHYAEFKRIFDRAWDLMIKGKAELEEAAKKKGEKL